MTSPVVQALFNVLQHQNIKVEEACIRSIKIIFRTNQQPDPIILQTPNLFTLVYLITHSNDSIAVLAANVVSTCHFVDPDSLPEYQLAFINEKGIEAAMGLLSSIKPNVFTPIFFF